MRERPILFSGPMVRAILEGCKTQTRRVVKIQPESDITKYAYKGNGAWLPCDDDLYSFRKLVKCPYGKPGDRLWVRETWGVGTRPCPIEGWRDGIEYRADEAYITDERDNLPLYDAEEPDDVCLDDYSGKGWRPSIHMFRWASRINLEITAIRAERVQDITETDLITEGFDGYNGTWRDEERFRNLWDSINAKRGYPWKDNPWVWVVEFKVINASA